jgi:NAD(P)-dependent dehydrogenase (short-subunit alcohol dehydrogenase family)
VTQTEQFGGLVAVVTGGASGIGAAITARLRTGGARVAVLDRAVEGAEADLALSADITDDEAVRSAIARVVD